MFCENCGKSLIRGYNFCLECGTPVPPENVEPEQSTAEEQSQGMPEIQPASNDGGTLVFCTNCGMRMQSSTAYCEQCGQQLQNNSASGGSYSNLPKNGDVPLWNTERVDYGYETMSEGEIEQINNFMNGGGIADASDYEEYSEISANDTFANAIGGADGSSMPDISGTAAEIDALTAQFANMVQPSSSEMPAIGTQEQHIQDEIVKVENFAMDTSYVDDDYVDQGALPVIEGASMEYDPDEPEPEDPNAFEMTPEAIEDITPVYEPAQEIAEERVYEEAASDENGTAPLFAAAAGVVAAEAISEAYEETVAETPVYEDPVQNAPVYEEPVEEAPVYEEPVEEAPVYEEPVEEAPVYVEPVEEAPVFEEPVEEAPVYEEPVEEAPVYEDVPTYEGTPAEDTAPAEDTFAIPLYGADGDTASYTQQNEPEYSSDIPLFGAPEEEAPVYTEPEAPVYEEPVAELPTYEETVPAYEEAPTEEATEDDTAAVAAAALAGAAIAGGFAAEESAPVPDYSEPAPAYNEPAPDYSAPAETDYTNSYDTYNSSADNSAASFAAAAAVTTAEEETEPAIDLGKLVYCRNCGQDMYEKETVCKNCGAPKRPEYQPPRTRQGKAKEPFKLFGIFSIPSIIVIVVVIIALGAIILPSLKKDDIVDDTSSKPSISTTSGISGNEQLNAGNTSDNEDDSSVPTEPEQTTTSTTAATTTTPVESTPVDAESAEPIESDEPVASTSGTSASTPSTPATTPTTTPSTTTTPKPNTTTTPAVTTPQQSGGTYTPSATSSLRTRSAIR